MSFMLMIAGSYPNYHALQFDHDVRNCIVASMAHHYCTSALAWAILSCSAGGIAFIFSYDAQINRKFPGLVFTIILLGMVGVAGGADYLAVSKVAKFWGRTAQPALMQTGKPMDGYICK
ncbi:hypothetical protein [Acetobacter nitrogenifigens]|uniref:hypothetical protein n=1 Tax=Acetobacter nitrogenifigens TaxID=285268 RepID=UPI0012B60123|nr:hypothetical protein [Acetobacter nitrogenifigens]